MSTERPFEASSPLCHDTAGQGRQGLSILA